MRRRRREFKLGQRRRKDEDAEGLLVRVRLDEGTVLVPDEEGAAASMVIRVDGCSSGGSERSTKTNVGSIREGRIWLL